MNRKLLAAAAVPAFALLAASVIADDGDDRKDNRFRAELKPANEVPSVSSVARGRFKMTIDDVNQSISYEVSYQGLEGDVTQSHIHIGQRHTLGGVSVFLCANPPAGPPAGFPVPPACPASPATVSGTLTGANVIGPNGQGIAPTSATVDEFQELINMIRSGDAYANVHSSKFPTGEVRGQIERKH